MKITEIKRMYHNEWLLIEVAKFGEDYDVVEGKVLVNSSSRDEIYQALLKYRGKQLAIEYVGQLPKEISVLV